MRWLSRLAVDGARARREDHATAGAAGQDHDGGEDIHGKSSGFLKEPRRISLRALSNIVAISPRPSCLASRVSASTKRAIACAGLRVSPSTTRARGGKIAPRRARGETNIPARGGKIAPDGDAARMARAAGQDHEAMIDASARAPGERMARRPRGSTPSGETRARQLTQAGIRQGSTRAHDRRQGEGWRASACVGLPSPSTTRARSGKITPRRARGETNILGPWRQDRAKASARRTAAHGASGWPGSRIRQGSTRAHDRRQGEGWRASACAAFPRRRRRDSREATNVSARRRAAIDARAKGGARAHALAFALAVDGASRERRTSQPVGEPRSTPRAMARAHARAFPRRRRRARGDEHSGPWRQDRAERRYAGRREWRRRVTARGSRIRQGSTPSPRSTPGRRVARERMRGPSRLAVDDAGAKREDHAEARARGDEHSRPVAGRSRQGDAAPRRERLARITTPRP